MIVVDVSPETGEDLWLLGPDGEARQFLATPVNDTQPSLSPDGSLLAYSSNETGRPEIYVVQYPGPGARVPISREGGRLPRWSPDGATIFYMQGDSVVAAGLSREGTKVDVHDRQELFSGKFLTRYDWSWDVAPDGRFLMIERGADAVPDRIHVVLDWFTDLAPSNP